MKLRAHGRRRPVAREQPRPRTMAEQLAEARARLPEHELLAQTETGPGLVCELALVEYYAREIRRLEPIVASMEGR